MATTNTCKKCGCEDKALTTPAPCPTPIGCPDPIPCSEIFDAQCVLYTQDPILCGTDIVVNTNTVVSDALNDIIEYFCNQLTVTTDLVCGDVTVVAADTSLVDALADIVDYFCQNSGGSVSVVEAGTGIDVTAVTVGDTTTYTVALEPVIAKAIQYSQHVQAINVGTMPSPNVYGFPSVGYSTLTYTNSTATVKTYKVFGSYDTNSATISPNNSGIANWVDGAIIKTITGVDSILWQSLGTLVLNGFLFWGPNGGDVIGSGIPTHLLLDDQGDNVEFRFLNGSLPRNVSFFQLVTLNPGESVSLKFKTKDGATPGNLLAAQLLVEEI
jgi:hypothetical protein